VELTFLLVEILHDLQNPHSRSTSVSFPRFESLVLNCFGFFVANGLLRRGLSGWVYTVDAELHPRRALYFSEMAALTINLQILGASVFIDLNSWHIYICSTSSCPSSCVYNTRNVSEFAQSQYGPRDSGLLCTVPVILFPTGFLTLRSPNVHVPRFACARAVRWPEMLVRRNCQHLLYDSPCHGG